MIIIEPCAGLGNRFIGLASAYHASRKTKSPLTVIWKEETVMGAPMDRLFTLPQDIKVEGIKEFGYRIDAIGQLKGNKVKNRYKKIVKDGFMECDDIMNLYEDRGEEGVEEFIRSHENVYIKATNPFWNLFQREDTFDFISPAQNIVEKTSQVLRNLPKDRLVGVHIRRTDHIEAIKNSPLELFIEKMKVELENNEDTLFYVATDDRATEEELRGIFKDKIITFEDKSLARDDIKGIEDAYVEMRCLAGTRKIYGSFNSTFSLMASKFGHIELEVVKRMEN